MTRRYGRNQKRAHRAEMARIQAELIETARKAAADQAARLNERKRNQEDTLALQEVISDARETLGEHHPAFGRPSHIERSAYPVFQVEVPDRRDRTVLSGAGSPDRETLRFERVHVLRSELEQDTLDRQLHLRVLLGNEGTYGYGLSWTALKTLPRQVLVRRIALELAEMIVRDLRGVGRG